MAATTVLHPSFEVTEKLRDRFRSRCLPMPTPDGCVFWTGPIQRHGYGAFSIDSRKIDAHVAAWRIANGGEPVPLGQLIRHKCNNRACVNTDHLELGSHQQNMMDASRNDLSSCRHRGEDNHKTVLTEPVVRAIKTLRAECGAVSKGLVWINHKTRYRDKSGIHPLAIFNWPFYSEVVWDRRDSVAINARKFAPSHEYIYGFGVPHYWDSTKNALLSVWQITPERNVKSHPCPFPVSIASRCITASCPEGGVVLDPFMGSGTTLLAARQEGRRGIGIEINPKYCDVAIERLRQKTLF